MTPRVDPEFEAFCPPLSDDEAKRLRASIERDGCRDPLDVWGGVLVDGHNRLRICTELGIPYETRELTFKSRADALVWMGETQLARRNLNDWNRCELARRMKGPMLELARERKAHGSTAPGRSLVETLPQASAGKTRDKLAAKADTSPRTFDKVDLVAEVAETGGKTDRRNGTFIPVSQDVQDRAKSLRRQGANGDISPNAAAKELVAAMSPRPPTPSGLVAWRRFAKVIETAAGAGASFESIVRGDPDALADWPEGEVGTALKIVSRLRDQYASLANHLETIAKEIVL